MAAQAAQDLFVTPKPSSLIKRILQIATDKDSIVLDSFAGSGTTAQAVLALNKEDGGNRRFVLIECEDYVDSITAERVRRVIAGVPSAKDASLQAGLGGAFSYFKLGGRCAGSRCSMNRSCRTTRSWPATVFFTATGQEFEPEKIDKQTGFIGSNGLYDVFLIYEADVEKLKNMALTLREVRALPGSRNKLVFAPYQVHRWRSPAPAQRHLPAIAVRDLRDGRQFGQMILKEYQQRALETVKEFLQQLSAWREKAAKALELDAEMDFDWVAKAWEKTAAPQLPLPRRNGLGERLPSFCLQIPTGGGKTLLATKGHRPCQYALQAAANRAGAVDRADHADLQPDAEGAERPRSSVSPATRFVLCGPRLHIGKDQRIRPAGRR